MTSIDRPLADASALSISTFRRLDRAGRSRILAARLSLEARGFARVLREAADAFDGIGSAAWSQANPENLATSPEVAETPVSESLAEDVERLLVSFRALARVRRKAIARLSMRLASTLGGEDPDRVD